MGFIKNLFQSREIGRLEDLVKTSPAPSLFVRLAELYSEKGEVDHATAIRDRGMELFPESPLLLQAQENAEHSRRDAEKKRIAAKLEQYPSPILYARLAELHMRDEEWEVAEEVCQRGLRAFGNYGGLWCAKARLDLASGDLTQAVARLEKACSLDNYNYDALMLLTETYLRQGQAEAGRETLNKILYCAPGDERAMDFLKNFAENAARLAAEGIPAARQPAPTAAPRKETIRVPEKAPAPAAAGETGQTQTLPRPASRRGTVKTSSGVGTGLGEELKQIRKVEGVTGTILIDPFGLVIASDLPEGQDEELTGALLTNIGRLAESGAPELGLGEFEDAIIESAAGNLHVLCVAKMTLGVFASPKTKLGLLQRAIHAFAEQVLDRQE